MVPFQPLKSPTATKNKLLVTHDKTVSVTIENQMIKSNVTVKLLGITTDSKLNTSGNVTCFRENFNKHKQRQT